MSTRRPTKAQSKRVTKFSVRLKSHVRLDLSAAGEISATLDHQSLDLGTYTTALRDTVRQMKCGLPCSAVVGDEGNVIDTDAYRLVQELASHGLVEYLLATDNDLLAIIEPQVAGYWPRLAPIQNTDVVELSRFAYLRRRDDQLVLESPLSGAVFVICNSSFTSVLGLLTKSHEVRLLRELLKSGELDILTLLVENNILSLNGHRSPSDRRAHKNNEQLGLWEFHDLLFHARSTEGRNPNAVGASYEHGQSSSPAPATRPSWPGKKIMLARSSLMSSEPTPLKSNPMRQRRSTRTFDDQSPITIVELARFLELTARIVTKKISMSASGSSDSETSTSRPYPSAGASYELELYLTIGKCNELQNGFYHYDAAAHALVPIKAQDNDIEAMLLRSAFAMGADFYPQVLITIAARFARVSWKYSSIAYALILKDAGVLTQVFYQTASDLGLGGCAIGLSNIDLFAKMTGIEFFVEGPIGQFALGRPAKTEQTFQ